MAKITVGVICKGKINVEPKKEKDVLVFIPAKMHHEMGLLTNFCSSSHAYFTMIIRKRLERCGVKGDDAVFSYDIQSLSNTHTYLGEKIKEITALDPLRRNAFEESWVESGCFQKKVILDAQSEGIRTL